MFKWKALFLGFLPLLYFKGHSSPVYETFSDQAAIPKAEKKDSAVVLPAPPFSAIQEQDTFPLQALEIDPALSQDTMKTDSADTLVVLKEIVITGCKDPLTTCHTMGMMVMIEKKVIDMPESGSHISSKDVVHLSRRQEIKQWLRHFFRLD